MTNSAKHISRAIVSFFLFILFIIQSTQSAFAAVLLTEPFTGTTIDTTQWTEIDPAGPGGTDGDVRQNGTLSVAASNINGVGSRGLVSNRSFSSTNLEFSATMSTGGSPMIGYGDHIYTGNGKAYLIYISGGNVLGIVWNNGLKIKTACGTVSGSASFKMATTSTGFKIYKNGVLLCTITTGAAYLVNDKPVFLQSDGARSTFDGVTVAGDLPTIPSAPLAVSAIPGDKTATVSFSAPASSGGVPNDGYIVQASPGPTITSGSSSPIVVSGLTNDLSYTFTVTAINSFGNSPASAPTAAVIPRVIIPADPISSLTATGMNSQVLLGWYAPEAHGSPITDYVIDYRQSGAEDWTVFIDGTSTKTKTTVSGLTNGVTYEFRVRAVNAAGLNTPSAPTLAIPAVIKDIVFVMTGESNSGGQALNTKATAAELAPTTAVQILHNTKFVFEPLDIGTNNNIGHTGLPINRHGLELGLANAVNAQVIPGIEQIRLVKTGQGGSRLSQWNVGGNYWNQFLQRTAAAKSKITTPHQWVVWMSLGINDYLAGTSVNSYRTAMTAHIQKIKNELPGAIIVLTQFQAMTANSGYPAYNTVLSEIAAREPNVYVVDTKGAGLDDSNHFSYVGYKEVANRMLAVTKTELGLVQPAPAVPNPTPPLNRGCQATVPVGKPIITSITRSNTQVVLTFIPPTYASRYSVQYGLAPDDVITTLRGLTASPTGSSRNVGEYMVGFTTASHTPIYTFQIVGNNNCATGTWSDWRSAPPKY